MIAPGLVRRRPALAIVLGVFALAGVILLSLVPPTWPERHITAVAFSPDGQFLVAGEREGDIVVWRVPSWKQHAAKISSDGGLNTLDFSRDSRVLASAGRSLRLWSTQDWKPLRGLGKPGAVYGTARFDHDRLIASVNAAERIELWNAATGQLVRSICCSALYGDLSFSPDGKWLAAAGHWPRFLDVATGVELRRLVEKRDPTFAAVAFRSDGRVLATGSQDGKTRLWDVTTGVELTMGKKKNNYVETVAFHPNGQLLAYGVREGAVWLWDTAKGVERMVGDQLTGNVAFSADGRLLAHGVRGGTIRLWDVAEAREITRLH